MSSRKSMEIWPTDLATPQVIAPAQTTKHHDFCKPHGTRYAKETVSPEEPMKPRITIGETSRKQLELTLWRRLGCDGWFLVQTTGKASHLRNDRLVRLPRGPKPRRSRMAFASQTRVTSGINL